MLVLVLVLVTVLVTVTVLVPVLALVTVRVLVRVLVLVASLVLLCFFPRGASTCRVDISCIPPAAGRGSTPSLQGSDLCSRQSPDVLWRVSLSSHSLPGASSSVGPLGTSERWHPAGLQVPHAPFLVALARLPMWT